MSRTRSVRSRTGLAVAASLLMGATMTVTSVVTASSAYAVTRTDIVGTARAEVGVAEPSGCDKYGVDCSSTSWCAAFVEWVWKRAGVSDVPKTLVARGVGQWGVEHGLFKSRSEGGKPQPGDIVVYGTPANQMGGHVGLVESVHADGTITTIEGNYSNKVTRRSNLDPAKAVAGQDGLHISGYVTPPGTSSAPQAGGFGDWDGDGKADVLARGSAGDLTLYKGAGNATFKGGVRAGTGWGAMNAIVRHGDFDGDGHEDVIAREASNGKLFLYSGNGKGGFKEGRGEMGTGWGDYTPVPVGDLDEDGHNDLLGRNDATGVLSLYRGNGDGRLKAGSTQIGGGWEGYDLLTGTGDFDGDGHADLIARQTATGKLFLYRGSGSGAFKPGSTQIGNGWDGIDAVVSAGDVDGDGHNDLLARQKSSGKLFLYRGNGDGTIKSGSTLIGSGWNAYNTLG